MKQLVNTLTLFILLSLIGHAANAAQITVIANDTKNRPVKDVRFSFLNTGAVSPPTTAEGRTIVALLEGFKPGQNAELRVGKIKDKQPDWVFISPWDGRVMMPVYGEIIKVVLARRGDREALESGDGAKAMAQSILVEFNKQTAAQQPVTDEQRRRILAEQACRYGLSGEEIDNAIRAWKERAEDPYDIGIVALYERNYPRAIEELEKSLGLRKAQETKSQGKVAEAAYFLGVALYERGLYAQAVETYRQAAERLPDPFILNAYGLALLQAAKYLEAKVQFETVIRIYEKTLGPDHPNVARV